MKTKTRIIGIILAVIMILGVMPATVFAKGGKDEGGSDPISGSQESGEEISYYSVDVHGGTVTLVSGSQDAGGKYARDSIVTIAFDYDEYTGHTFDCWKSTTGDVIPRDTFKLVVRQATVIWATLADVIPTWGDWTCVYDSHDCLEDSLWARYDNANDLVEYKTVRYDDHLFGEWTYIDENNCSRVCSRCGCEETDAHDWTDETVYVEATHEHDGTMRATCTRCGTTADTTIPRTDEHVWDADNTSDAGWEIITPSENGNYGVRRRHCLYCDAYEDYYYLAVDFKSLFTGNEIRYKETYGGKLTNNESYFSWVEGNLTYYIYAVQYVYAYSSGNDNNQTWAFMFIDDGDATNLKSVYLSKTTGSSSVAGYTWAEYGKAYDFDGWFSAIRMPDHAIQGGIADGGVVLSNTMSPRSSLLTAWGDDWAEEYNKLMIPAGGDPEPFTPMDQESEWYTWQLYEDSFSFAERMTPVGDDGNGVTVYEETGGFAAVTYRRWVSGDDDAKAYEYFTVDENSGLCVKKVINTTQYPTVSYFDLFDEMQTTDHTEIATMLRSFSGEQGRSQFGASFSLNVPDPLQAARVIIDHEQCTVEGRDWSFLTNDGRCFRIQRSNNSYYNLTATWNGDTAAGWVFDGWEIYDCDTRTWSTFSTDPVITINTYEAPLTGLTIIRPVAHCEPVDDTVHVTVTGGRFNMKTYSNTYYYENEGDVPAGSYVVPIEESEYCPAGMQFDHWDIYQGGALVNLTPENYQWNLCYTVDADTDFVAVYVPQKYYVSVYADNGYVYLDGDTSEEFCGGEYAAGEQLTLTTEGYDGYPYFYGWFYIDWSEKTGTTRELLSTDTEITITVTPGEGSYTAMWGNTEEMPPDYHDIIMRTGFVQSNWGLLVNCLRVKEYNSVSFFRVPGSDAVIVEWALSGVLSGTEWSDICTAESVDYDYEGFYYLGSNDEQPTIINVTATVENAPVLWGDANGDGEVDLRDATRLAQYANDDSVEIFPGADANGDGEVDLRDATRIAQYANDDSVTLGPDVTVGTLP